MFSTGILSPIDSYIQLQKTSVALFFCESVDKLFRSDLNVVVNMKKGYTKYTKRGTGVSPPKKIFEILERLFRSILGFFFFFTFGFGGGGHPDHPPPPWIRHWSPYSLPGSAYT